MMNLCCKVLQALQGRILCTAESCTGGGIGAAITAVPGSSSVYRGGIISYANSVKQALLGVSGELLEKEGAVSAPVACEMARGAKEALHADIAVSVTGLAGPGGDDYGNSVGTVFVGYSDNRFTIAEKYLFLGDREEIRNQAIRAALLLVLRENS